MLLDPTIIRLNGNGRHCTTNLAHKDYILQMQISDCQGGGVHGYLYPNPNITEVFWEATIFRHIYT